MNFVQNVRWNTLFRCGDFIEDALFRPVEVGHADFPAQLSVRFSKEAADLDEIIRWRWLRRAGAP